jgi:2-hydroxychromene-2-carboxylate isomerase
MQYLLSPARLESKRLRFESRRAARKQTQVVHFFHQEDDPYSQLLAAVLPQFQARYHIQMEIHCVSAPSDAAAPERALLEAYSQRDAALLAQHYGIDGSNTSPLRASHPHETREQADKLRKRLGHYLGATLWFGGEWYWGVDRLHHLEKRLQTLGLQTLQFQQDAAPFLFPPGEDLQNAVALTNPPAIDFFFSFRSPYSAIVAPRVFELARRTGAQVNLRYVLPMVMRGLPVPREKRMYIVFDTAREARMRSIPFGRLNDPVGKPTERGLALMPLALAQGKGESYVLSFMQGVWAEGLDAGSDKDLRTIVERCGLLWSEAQSALQHNGWRSQAEENRSAMFALGLWGVPSFHVGDAAVWGQDRLWAVQEALLKK